MDNLFGNMQNGNQDNGKLKPSPIKSLPKRFKFSPFKQPPAPVEDKSIDMVMTEINI